MSRILIVDDSRTQAELLQWILEEEGFAVDAAADGEAAWEKFGRTDYDLVVSDIVMPGLSGYELCHRIKQDPKGRSTPVILLSTLNDPMDIIRGLECEANNFITKPYDRDQLVTRIRAVLQNRAARAGGKLAFGVEVFFLGKKFVINSEKEQILDLLIATFEDIVRTNRGLQESKAALAAAKIELETYAQELEHRVRDRTAELFEQQRQLAQAQAIAHVGNWRVALAANKVEWSDEMYWIYGVERERSVHTLGDMMSLVHPEDRNKLANMMNQSIADKSSYRHEFRIIRPKGEERYCWTEGHCQFDDRRDVVALFGICQDITERRLVEQQLVQAQKMEAIGNFTGGMAHDFNNLLGVIIGNLDLLRDLPNIDPAADEFTREALDAAMRGADLTRRLLAFARRQPLKPQLVNLNESVAGLVKLLGRVLGEDIEISLNMADEIWRVLVDPVQLEASLTNLAANARDAMSKGGLLTIATANRTLDNDYTEAHADVPPGDYVMIEVSDTGIGMSPEVIQRIFEPFYTTKEIGKGTGLGLSMVFGFLKQSGGHINVYSEPGIGTIFRLYFPRSPEDVAADTKKSPAAPLARSAGETVLAVEDNAAMRRIVLRQLADLGYRALEADSAAAALALLERERVDLLFTDIVMPGEIGGFELARQVLTRWPSIKVVLTSGFSETKINGNLGVMGASARLLSKPYRKEDLARLLREALES